ncbi:MAG TPA: lasso peptide biosynthesis B2 protein [Candidatus Brocadiaceae bacterium]|nr:lasso peptide biosynthesis B2 protein [Candidatus Brocadiaceae bacterium]
MRVNPIRKKLRFALLVAEAVFLILFARILLAFFPFSSLTPLFSHPHGKIELRGGQRRAARMWVKKAIFTAWKRLPLKNTCFHRAIAAHFMLRRRGVATTLYYGAARLPQRGLSGHVWLQDGEVGVVGHHISKEYHTLASFP